MDSHLTGDARIDSHVLRVDVLLAVDYTNEGFVLVLQRFADLGNNQHPPSAVVECSKLFYLGRISCQRLLDVVVGRFLMLARRVTQETYISEGPRYLFNLVESYYRLWAGAMRSVADWAYEEAKTRASPQLVEKHSELVKAVIDSKVLEVNTLVIQFD